MGQFFSHRFSQLGDRRRNLIGWNAAVVSDCRGIMTTRSTIVRQSELLNLLILDRSSMEELGHVETLWMYPQKHRVMGLISKSGFLGSTKAAFNLAQLDTLGDGSILVNSKPEPTDAQKVRQLESLILSEVWTDAGRKAGEIIDCLFNLRTGVISNYLFVVNRWRGVTDGIYLLPPDQILSIGKTRVLIADRAMASLTTYSDGIKQQFSKASAAIKSDYVHLTDDVRTAAEKAAETAKQTAEQATGRLQSLTGRVKERATVLAQQAKETAQRLGEQVKESTQTLAEQAKETGKSLLDTLQLPEIDQEDGDFQPGDQAHVEATIDPLTDWDDTWDAPPVPKPEPPSPSPSDPGENRATSSTGSVPPQPPAPDRQTPKVDGSDPAAPPSPQPPSDHPRSREPSPQPPISATTPPEAPSPSFAEWDTSELSAILDSPDIAAAIPAAELADDDPWI